MATENEEFVKRWYGSPTVGNSNVISRNYLDSLFIETRYMNSGTPSTEFTLYGETFSSPIMSAALSHIDHFMAPGSAERLARGVIDANAAFWYGMAPDEEIDRFVSMGARMIEVIKPFADRDKIYRKIEHAEACGLMAVGIDIDHVFANDGSPCICFGEELRALTTAELADICKAAKLPVIAKGVLSTYDAEETLKAGVGGMVLSHHHNRIEFAVAPLRILPDIAKVVDGSVPLFVDCMIQTGMDALKALALGATAVGIGRPLMTAIRNDPENGVKDYLLKANQELAKAMAYTGCTDLSKIDSSIIHFSER
ncbi:MAG: alpha-hydroxy-acid oxidizing protein [Oscillospiraceae bacterium]|nr:alpha-hydroxy-acid oxidizing protein [Oscillospiraceae bacterium]